MDDLTVNRSRRQQRAMSRHRADARDAGLDLIQRANRWLIAGALTCTGAVSLVAANAFHGRTLTAAPPSAAARTALQPAQPAGGDDAGALQSPAQAPAPAQPAPSPVVSGGS